jgi:hypothetical protein
MCLKPASLPPGHGARVTLLAACVVSLSAALPVQADDDLLRKELDALKQRVEQLERELAKRPPAPTPPAQPAPAPEEKPATTAEALRAPKGSRVQISGFVEARATNIANPRGEPLNNVEFDFEVTRFRPRITYLLDRQFMATVQLNASTRSTGVTNISARDAFLEYHNAGYYMRFGQQKIPFGYEVFRQGDETSPYLERARVFSVLFPDERDIGAVFGTNPKNAHAASFAVGVLNGDGINHADGDTAKAVAGKVEVPLDRHNTVGASFYSGTTTSPLAAPLTGVRSQTKEAAGAEYRLATGRFSLRSEYLWGHAFGADVNGGYGYLGYDTGHVGNFFLRHDIFDPDQGHGHDYWRRTSLGWFKDFTPRFRLTLEYDFVKNRATHGRDDTFGLEAQANF